MQAAHSAISIIERMDAQKVMDKERNRNERLDLKVSDDSVVFFEDFVQLKNVIS